MEVPSAFRRSSSIEVRASDHILPNVSVVNLVKYSFDHISDSTIIFNAFDLVEKVYLHLVLFVIIPESDF